MAHGGDPLVSDIKHHTKIKIGLRLNEELAAPKGYENVVDWKIRFEPYGIHYRVVPYYREPVNRGSVEPMSNKVCRNATAVLGARFVRGTADSPPRRRLTPLHSTSLRRSSLSNRVQPDFHLYSLPPLPPPPHPHRPIPPLSPPRPTPDH